jgi:DNA-directed RNA polymerase subunit RPC12/RpoP
VAATSSGAGRRSRSEAEGKPEVAAQPGQPAAPPGGDDDKDGGEEAASSAQPGKKANGGGARPKAAASSGSSGRARGRGGGGSGTGGGSGRGRGGRGRRGTASPADEVASGKRRKLSSRVSRRMLVEGKDSESEDRLIERAKEPPYDFTLVPRCADELADSVVIRVASRRMCTYAIGEMFHLCNEAARRQAIRRQQLSGAGGSTDSTNESASRLQSKLQAATEKKPVAAGKHEAAKGSKQPPPPQQPSQPHPKLEVQLPTRVTENGQTTQVHSVPTEQDAPPRVPGQPPASPTVKYVYPDPNTFEKGEIILCPTCSKNMKAPMRARALRCANCRCEIYPKHRKQGWAGALYEQLQQSPTSNVQGPSPRNPAPLKTSSGAAAAKPKATAGGGGGGGGGDAAGLSAKTAPTDGGGSGAQQSRGRGRARGGRSTGGGRNSGGKRRGSAAAGSDSEATSPPSSPRYDKPLSLDYIADRLDIDNPLRGYMVCSPLFAVGATSATRSAS